MRILWFGRSSDHRGSDRVEKDGASAPRSPAAQTPRAVRPVRALRAVKAVKAVRMARPRTDDEVTLALSTLPRYHVLLRLRPQDAPTAEAWADVLAPALGERRAAYTVAAAARAGSALVVTCPRELAEHYRDALIGHGLPCAIEPA